MTLIEKHIKKLRLISQIEIITPLITNYIMDLRAKSPVPRHIQVLLLPRNQKLLITSYKISKTQLKKTQIL